MAKRVSPTGGFFYSPPTIARHAPSTFIKCVPPTITRRKPPTIERRTPPTITRRANQTATCPPCRQAFLKPYLYQSPYNPIPPQNRPTSSCSQGFLSLFFFLFTWLLLIGSSKLQKSQFTNIQHSSYHYHYPHLTLSRFQTLTRFFRPPCSVSLIHPFTHSPIHTSQLIIHNPPHHSPITLHPSPLTPHLPKKKIRHLRSRTLISHQIFYTYTAPPERITKPASSTSQ